MSIIDKIELYTCGVGDLLFIIAYAITMREWYKTWTGRFMMGWPVATGILFWLSIISEWITVPLNVARFSVGLIAVFIIARFALLIKVNVSKRQKAKSEYYLEIGRIVQEEKNNV